jgi:tRNA uridine 5-carboxymethylaminomethyl modification enzyme
LLTSRAEYRLLLRHDNADLRIREYGYQVGLINEEQHQKLNQKKCQIKELTEILKNIKITPSKENLDKLNKLNTPILKDGISAYEFLKRPEITIQKLNDVELTDINYTKDIIEQVEINIKYEGYILKEQREAEKMIKLEHKKIPEAIDYDLIPNIASEARQKLKEVRPTSIGQALRISGVNPADISILMVYLRKEYAHES